MSYTLRLDSPMHHIRLEPPERSGNTISFRWSLEPYSPLYRKQEFQLRFPESVDVSGVSESLWLRIALICLHSHWAILGPCRVDLPVRLPDGEAEAWMRLVDAEAATFEVHRGSSKFERRVELREEGCLLPVLPPIPESPRAASAFSGGKDSLLQAGLLCELLDDPILVATTSPMPPMIDHHTARRREVFAEIVRRRGVSLVEVQSDFRSHWDNGFARRLGYPVWITEATDAFLYFSGLLAVAAAENVRHLFLASENEVQQTVELGGRIIQHTHCMYSVATQRAIEAILRPSGIRCSSATAALSSSQVERLLWTRYRDLCDLQYSCFEVNPSGLPCSGCSKCFRAALCALAAGDPASSLGLDLSKLMTAMRGWAPRTADHGELPVDIVVARLNRQVFRYLEEIPFSRFVRGLGAKGLLSYGLIRMRMLGQRPAAETGFSLPFLAAADPLVRAGLRSIFSEYFPGREDFASEEEFRRSDSLSRWITEPIGGLD